MWQLQSPGETLDWRNDWTDWLNENDGVASSDWSISPNATLADDFIETGSSVTVVFVSDLELGQSYELKNTITTDDGLTGTRSITIRCSNK
jgi:hypothetical protein